VLSGEEWCAEQALLTGLTPNMERMQAIQVSEGFSSSYAGGGEGGGEGEGDGTCSKV
jgi:hypothetical protein